MGTEIFCIGFEFDRLHVYDVETDIWRNIPSKKPGRSFHSTLDRPYFFALEKQLYTLLRTTSLVLERIRDSYTCACVYDRSTGAWKESDCTLPYEGWEPYGTAETCPVAKMFLPQMYSKDVLPVMRQNALNQQGVTGVENSA
ncbi:Broad-Complex, Tramtrack and Bric a brac [Branchiostoma belcheri]|nr:Broad-Complex, Tramtrack and Bric a brac [Branchiostoma belcheri]